jgi:hypothetical protein
MDKPIEIQINNTEPENQTPTETIIGLKKELPALLQIQVVNAQLRRAHFNGLVASGFTEDQAMWLIK